MAPPRWLSLLAVAAALLGLAALAVPRLPAADTWWQLAAGRLLVESGQLFPEDPFSFGPGRGPWLNHEWLAEVVFYLLARAGGLEALFLFRTGMVVLAFGVLPLVGTARRGVGLPVASAVVLGCGLAAEGQAFFDARPYLFTYLGLSLTLQLALGFLETGRARWLAPLPLITVLWANCHGGYILGPLALAAAAAGCLLEPGRPGRVRPLLLVSALSLALVAVGTPFGLEILVFPFSLTGTTAFTLGLNEWARPDLADQGPYLALLAITLGLSVRADWPRRFWAMAFLGAGLVAWRHIPLGALASAHLLPDLVPDWPPERLRARWASGLFWTGALLASAWALGQRLEGGAEAWTLTRSHFPVAAVRFLAANPGLPRELYNPYEWGGYLEWHLAPHTLTFVDGRANTVFSQGRYAEALLVQFGDPWRRRLEQAGLEGVLAGHGGWEEVLEAYGIRMVLATHLQGDLAERLSRSPRWFRIYDDPVAAVYLREQPDLRALVPALVTPESTWTRLERARRELLAGREAEALRVLEEVIREEPRLAGARVLRGTLLLRRGQESEGEGELLEALRLDPRVPDAHFNLAVLALHRGARSQALAHARAELAGNPGHPGAASLVRELGGGG